MCAQKYNLLSVFPSGWDCMEESSRKGRCCGSRQLFTHPGRILPGMPLPHSFQYGLFRGRCWPLSVSVGSCSAKEEIEAPTARFVVVCCSPWISAFRGRCALHPSQRSGIPSGAYNSVCVGSSPQLCYSCPSVRVEAAVGSRLASLDIFPSL